MSIDNAKRRTGQRERARRGETPAEASTMPGAGLPRRPCRETLDMFKPRTLDLFTDLRQRPEEPSDG